MCGDWFDFFARSQISTLRQAASSTLWRNADIPNLILAMKIWKPGSLAILRLPFAGIYTTAVLRSTILHPASAKEGTSNFCILTVILAVVGLIVGLFFRSEHWLMWIYVINGYVGAILTLYTKKNITDLLKKKKKA